MLNNVFFRLSKAKAICFFLLFFSFVLQNCSSSKKAFLNPWKSNDASGWFFQSNKKEKAYPGMVYIKGGVFTKGGLIEEGIMKDWTNLPKKTYVKSFYMSQSEITNYDYKSYLAWIRLIFEESSDFEKIYKKALPKIGSDQKNVISNKWLLSDYFTHPSFDTYPVLISYLQAERFCAWLSDRINEKKFMQLGLLPKKLYESPDLYKNFCFSLEKFYKNPKSILDWMEDSDPNKAKKLKNLEKYRSLLVSRFRLPTEAQWEYAALALKKEKNSALYRGKKTWLEQIESKKRKFLDNFRENQESIGPNAVKKYPPNELGLYGMYGNVAEWVVDYYDSYLQEDSKEARDDFSFYKNLEEEEKDEKNKWDNKSKNQKEESIFLKNQKINLPKLRIVKGASYKDSMYMAYPSIRRYKKEDEATSWIGFRVVQEALEKDSK